MSTTGNIVLLAASTPRGVNRDKISMIISTAGCRSGISLMDAGSVFDVNHLCVSYMHAARALLDGSSRLRDPNMEVLIWISGKRQIGEALAVSGAGRKTRQLICCVNPPDWPKQEHIEVPPVIRRGNWSELGVDDDDIIPVDPPCDVPWGGPNALERLGISTDDKEKDRQLMALLEFISNTYLR